MADNETYEQPAPTCPGCGYALNNDDMNSDLADDDLWALAPNEGRTSVQCPRCATSYWVQGGYKPTYTTSFNEDDL